jgi:hypothetical protein
MKQPEFAHHYATLTDDEMAAINLADLVPEAGGPFKGAGQPMHDYERGCPIRRGFRRMGTTKAGTTCKQRT